MYKRRARQRYQTAIFLPQRERGALTPRQHTVHGAYSQERGSRPGGGGRAKIVAWLRRLLTPRRLGLGLAGLAVLFVALNLLLFVVQIGRVPLLTKVDGVSLSLRSPEQAKKLLEQQHAREKLQLTLGDKNYQTGVDKVGITIDTNAIIEKARHPGGLKSLPVIALITHAATPVKPMYKVDDAKVREYIMSLQVPERVEPTNATIVIPEDPRQPIHVQPEKPGHVFKQQAAIQQVLDSLKRQGSLHVELQMETLKPKITGAQLKDRVKSTNELLDTKLMLQGENNAKYELTQQDLRKTLTIKNDDKGLPAAVVDTGRIETLLQDRVNKQFSKAPTPRQVTLHDGEEVSSKEGASGRALNVGATARTIAEAIQSKKHEVRVTMATVNPPTHYTRTYSRTSTGLSVLLRDFAQNHGGTFSISVIDLSGGMTASYNAGRATTPASMYKLYLSYVALKKVEEGSLSMDAQTGAGTVDYCIQQMIRVSNNACGQPMVNTLGGGEAVNSYLRSQGWGSTKFTGSWTTSAADTADFLRKLQNRSLLNGGHTDFLINLMKAQIYRAGIPAGSPGATVANKVGFLGSLNHDGGIVYASRGTYVVSVMTTGSNFATIKDLSTQIYNLYNQ